jgi:hypothetical protein
MVDDDLAFDAAPVGSLFVVARSAGRRPPARAWLTVIDPLVRHRVRDFPFT